MKSSLSNWLFGKAWVAVVGAVGSALILWSGKVEQVLPGAEEKLVEKLKLEIVAQMDTAWSTSSNGTLTETCVARLLIAGIDLIETQIGLKYWKKTNTRVSMTTLRP
ncbi:MAG: hypothetical protein AAGD22_09425 [Verrucomicrobiota bacterium]